MRKIDRPWSNSYQLDLIISITSLNYQKNTLTQLYPKRIVSSPNFDAYDMGDNGGLNYSKMSWFTLAPELSINKQAFLIEPWYLSNLTKSKTR